MNPSLTLLSGAPREMQTMNNQITHLSGPCAEHLTYFPTVKFLLVLMFVPFFFNAPFRLNLQRLQSNYLK